MLAVPTTKMSAPASFMRLALSLADSSKKNQKYMYNICATSDVHHVISELD